MDGSEVGSEEHEQASDGDEEQASDGDAEEHASDGDAEEQVSDGDAHMASSWRGCGWPCPVCRVVVRHVCFEKNKHVGE